MRRVAIVWCCVAGILAAPAVTGCDGDDPQAPPPSVPTPPPTTPTPPPPAPTPRAVSAVTVMAAR